MRRSLTLLVPFSMVLLACALPQSLAPVHAPLTTEALKLQGKPTAEIANDWWRVYQSDTLNQLAEQALSQNPTLNEALARVHAARAVSAYESGGLLPNVGVDTNATRTRFSEYYIYPPPYGGSVFWNSNATVGAGWSPDLFGLQKSMVNASAFNVIAAEYQYRSAKTVLMANLVLQVFELQNTQNSLAIARESATLLAQKISLEDERVRAGIDGTSQRLQLDSALKDWQERIKLLELKQTQLRSSIAITVGQNPAHPPAYDVAIVDQAIPQLPEELPIDLLVRRADVKAAMAVIQSQQWRQAAAKAAFYPQVNLAAFVGYQSLSINNFVTAPARTLGIGPDVSLPLFDGGRLNANAALKNSELDAAISAYNQVVLHAIKDVTDGIKLVSTLQATLAIKTGQHDDAKKLLDQSQHRFSQGLQSRLTLIDARLTERHAEWERLTVATQLAEQKMDFLVALGGPPEPVLSSHPEVVP